MALNTLVIFGFSCLFPLDLTQKPLDLQLVGDIEKMQRKKLRCKRDKDEVNESVIIYEEVKPQILRRTFDD